MKKILLSLAVAATALCAGAQTFHQIEDGEVASCSQTNIEAQDWIDYSTTNYSDRSKCVPEGETIPNLSKTERVVTFTVSGCASFSVTAEGNKSVRSLIIGVDGTTVATQDWENNCNTYGPFETNNSGDCTITVSGNNGSIYLSSLTFFAPEEPILVSFSVGGEEMTINNTDMTITGSVAYDVDLATTEPVVTLGGSATDYSFDGNYNGGTLTISNATGDKQLSYTVTVTNRELDVTPPMPTGIYSEGVDIYTGTLAAVDKPVYILFNEPIEMEDPSKIFVYGMTYNENDSIILNEGIVEGLSTWTSGDSLYIQPSPRFNSNTFYIVQFNGAVRDMDGNVYVDGFGMGLQFKTEALPLTATDATPASDEYAHVMKITFSTDIQLLDLTNFYMSVTEDPYMPLPTMAPVTDVEVYGNNLYILDAANYPNGTLMAFILPTSAVRGVYFDMLTADPDLGFALVSNGFTQGDNSYRIGYNAPINDTYAMPSWLRGTAGVAVDRDYAGTDMTSGTVGAIRGGSTDSLYIDVPIASDIQFTVSATGSRTFVVSNNANEQLASVEAEKNTLYTLNVVMEEPGTIYLHTPGATGGFTIQGISIDVCSGVEGIQADKESNVRYANLVICNNGSSLEVYNLMGVCVARSEGNIDMSNMPKGVYIVRIDGKESMKIVR